MIKPSASSASAVLGGGVPPVGMMERRRAPRIAPLSADIYSGNGPARESSLADLKAKPRKPGEASFFYLDHHFQHNAVKVLPGEYFVSDENLVIMTVLGSCIAACLWDSRARVGGMNHFMLPDGDAADVSGRYGSYAMELLINEMLKLGARRETMQAKIFGGASGDAQLHHHECGGAQHQLCLELPSYRAHSHRVRGRLGYLSSESRLLPCDRQGDGQAFGACPSGVLGSAGSPG